MSDWRRADRGRPFSATDAAFAGFRLLSTDFGSIVAWALFSVVFLGVLFAVTLWGMAPILQEMLAAQQAGETLDAAQIQAMNVRMAPLNLITMVISLLFYPVLLAAVYRAILRPKRAFGHFRLGRAEFQQFLALLVVGLILFAVYFGGFIAVVVAAAVTAAAASKVAAIWIGVVGGLALVCGLVFLAVRLSFVGPATFDTGALRIGDAWAMTRGRFWPLLGAYVLAWALAILTAIGGLVVFALVAAPIALTSHAVLQNGLGAGGAVSPVLAGLGLLYVVVMSGIYGLIYGVIFGVAADAYRQIVGGAKLADVFDDDRSHAFGAAPAPAPPPPDAEYPIIPPRPPTSPPEA